MVRDRAPLLPIETILWLQTTCGNRAVRRLLERKAAVQEARQPVVRVATRRSRIVQSLTRVVQKGLVDLAAHLRWALTSKALGKKVAR